jgi:hypothetical protein
MLALPGLVMITYCLALVVDHVVTGTWYVIDLGGN